MPGQMLTVERLHELLDYDASTGILTWKKTVGSRGQVGDNAGSNNGSGYLLVRVDRGRYLAHRLAWLHVYGIWPKDQIDHRNGIRHDNRIANLREATDAENRQNKAMQSNNTSGFQGVSWFKASSKWQAKITVHKKQRHLGFYFTAEKARDAYLTAKAVIHKFQPVPRAI